MAKRGRPPVLDEMKQREIVAILSMGCSRRTAAHYVGCAHSTIQYTAERNDKFAEKLDRAESGGGHAHEEHQYGRQKGAILARRPGPWSGSIPRNSPRPILIRLPLSRYHG